MERDRLVSHLPMLLRYARSLTRSKAEGEALVEAALEALLKGETGLDPDKPVRIALLERVHWTWIPLDSVAPEPGDADEDLFVSLGRVPPGDRAALLLVHFERLSEADAAQVLHVSEEEVSRRVAQARRLLLRLARPRILTVEDLRRPGGPRASRREEQVDWDRLALDLGCETVGPVAFAEAAASVGSERPDLVIAVASGQALQDQLAYAAATCRERGIPLILMSDTPDALQKQPWAAREMIAALPLQPAALAALVRRALAGPTSQ